MIIGDEVLVLKNNILIARAIVTDCYKLKEQDVSKRIRVRVKKYGVFYDGIGNGQLRIEPYR